MLTRADIGRRVVICASDNFFQFIDGWIGTLVGIGSNGVGVVEVKDEEARTGGYVKTFYVPLDQLEITVI